MRRKILRKSFSFANMRDFERTKVKLRECPPPGNPLVLEGRVDLESEMPPGEDLLWSELPQRSSLYSICPSTSSLTDLSVDERLRAVYHLICDEKNYNFQLNTIISDFADPIRTYGLLSNADLNCLFDPVYKMASTSCTLIFQLESIVNRWSSATSTVGHLFNRQLIGQFLSFHNCFTQAKRVLRRKRHSGSGFNRFCHQQCRILNTPSLEELLLSPERRVLDYQDWLDSVMNRTPTDHPDMPHLKRAVQLLSDSTLLERSRDQVDRSTNEQRIEQVENSFPGANLQLLPRSISASNGSTEVVTRRRPKSLPGRRQMVFRSKVPLFTSPSQTVMSQESLSAKESFKRSYIKEGPAILTSGLQSHERYLFLFNDILLVAKEKERVANSYKLKEKIRLCEVWLKPDGMEEVAESVPQPSTSFVIGWPTANYVIQFSSPLERDGWYQILSQNVSEERFREFPQTTTMRVVCKDVRYESTHTCQVTNGQTAQEVLKKAAEHFSVSGEGDFQLWVDSGKENAPYPLYGHEIPFEILMSHYRDALADGTLESANPSDMASLQNTLKCQFVLRPKRGHNKKLKMTRKSATNIVTQIRKRMMFKQDSVDSGLPPTPMGKLFGHHLSTLSPDHSVPQPIMTLLKHLLLDGLYCKGIFRQTPKASTVRELRERLDVGEAVDFSKISPYVSASVLKEFFRSLPDCLLASDKFQTWLQLAELDDYPVKIAKTKQLLGQLAKANYEVLRHLVCLLKQIALKHTDNQMTSMNLAICFGYSLLWPAVEINIGDNCKRVPEVTQFLIERCVELFGPETVGLLGSIPENCQSSQDSGEESDTNSSSRPSSSLHATSKNLSRDSGLADPHLGTDESEASVPRSFSQSDDTEEDFYPPQRSTRGAKSAENIPQATNIVVSNDQQPEGPKSVTLDRRRSRNFSKDPSGADKSRPEFSAISSTDSLYNSFDFAGTFDSRMAPLRNSKRATVGTLHRSESGGHLVISESLELTLEKPNAQENRNLTLTVPIDSVDSSSVSPLSASERSECLSPDLLTRNPPELTRNSLGRKPARHRKGPAPHPPQTSPSESEDFTSSMSSLNSTRSHYNSSEPMSPTEPLCASIVLSCNNNSPTVDSPTAKVVVVEEETKKQPLTKAIVTQSILLSAPMISTTPKWESKARLSRISTPTKESPGVRPSNVLPYRITVPNGQDSDTRVLQGSALYSTPLTKTISTLEVPRKLSSASVISCNTTGEFINDSSTMTESTSSDESTPHVSRENSRAHEYEHKVPVVQKSNVNISDRLASLLKESGRTPVIQSRSKASRDANSTGYSSTSVLMKSTSTVDATSGGQQTFYVSKPFGNANRTRLPTYQEALLNRPNSEERRPTGRGDTRLRDLLIRCPRSLSSTSSSESNTSSIDLDSPPPEIQSANMTVSSRLPPTTSTTSVVVRSPPSSLQSSQIVTRIRRYDRENLRRKTLGGLDYLQAAKSSLEETTIRRTPVVRTTSCERLSPAVGDLDLVPSWSVRKLREIYNRNGDLKDNNSNGQAEVTKQPQMPVGRPHYDKKTDWRRDRLYESSSSSNVGGLVKATPVHIEVSDSRANYPVVYAPPLATEAAKSHYQLRLKSAANLTDNNNNINTAKSPVKRTDHKTFNFVTTRQSHSRTNTREPESYV